MFPPFKSIEIRFDCIVALLLIKSSHSLGYNSYKLLSTSSPLSWIASSIKWSILVPSEMFLLMALTFSWDKLSVSIWLFASFIFMNTFWLCLYCSSFPLLRNLYVSDMDSSILAIWVSDRDFCESWIFFWNPSKRLSNNVVKLLILCIFDGVMYLNLCNCTAARKWPIPIRAHLTSEYYRNIWLVDYID